MEFDMVTSYWNDEKDCVRTSEEERVDYTPLLEGKGSQFERERQRERDMRLGKLWLPYLMIFHNIKSDDNHTLSHGIISKEVW